MPLRSVEQLREHAFRELRKHQSKHGIPLAGSGIPTYLGRDFIKEAAEVFGSEPKVKMVMEAVGAQCFREPDGQPAYATPDYTPTDIMKQTWEAKRIRHESHASSSKSSSDDKKKGKAETTTKTTKPAVIVPSQGVFEDWVPSDVDDIDEYEAIKRDVVERTWSSHLKYKISVPGHAISMAIGPSLLRRVGDITSTDPAVRLQQKPSLLRMGLVLVPDARDPTKLPTYASPGFTPNVKPAANGKPRETPAYIDAIIPVKRKFLETLAVYQAKHGPASTEIARSIVQGWPEVVAMIRAPRRATDDDIVSILGAVAAADPSTGKLYRPRRWVVPDSALRHFEKSGSSDSSVAAAAAALSASGASGVSGSASGGYSSSSRVGGIVSYMESVAYSMPECAAVLAEAVEDGVNDIPSRVFHTCMDNALHADNVWAVAKVLSAAHRAQVSLQDSVYIGIIRMYTYTGLIDKVSVAVEAAEHAGVPIPCRVWNYVLATAATCGDRDYAVATVAKMETSDSFTRQQLSKFRPPVSLPTRLAHQY